MNGTVYSAMPIEEFLDMLRKAAEQRNDYPFIDKIDEILIAIEDADRCDHLRDENNDLRLEIENLEIEMAAERDRK